MNRSLAPVLTALVVLNLLTLVGVGMLWIRAGDDQQRFAEAQAQLVALEGQLAAVEAQVAGVERGVPISELSLRLGELENRIQEWVVAFSGDVDPAVVGTGDTEEVLEALEEIQAEIDALNERLDEICEGVPVC